MRSSALHGGGFSTSKNRNSRNAMPTPRTPDHAHDHEPASAMERSGKCRPSRAIDIPAISSSTMHDGSLMPSASSAAAVQRTQPSAAQTRSATSTASITQPRSAGKSTTNPSTAMHGGNEPHVPEANGANPNPPTVNENRGNQGIPARRSRATAGSIFGSPRERFAVFMLRSSARSARVLRNRPQ